MSVVLNAENFPDYGFRVYLKQTLGLTDGDVITDEIISTITSMTIASKYKAKDVTGIEYFTYLETITIALDYTTPSLESFALDLSLFPNLIRFELYGPTLKTLNLTPSSTLEQIEINQCSYHLALFDFHEYTNIQTISLSYSNSYNDPDLFISVIASGLTSLRAIQIYGGSNITAKLSSLDLDGCTNLERIDLGYMTVSSELDLSDYSNLKIFGARSLLGLESIALDSSSLMNVQVQDCKSIRNLDFGSGKNSIQELYLVNNGLDLRDTLDVSECVNLHRLRIPGVAYTHVDISNIPRILHAYTDQTQDLPTIKWHHDGPNIYYQSIYLEKVYNAGYSPLPVDADNPYMVKYVFEYDPECNIISDQLTIEDEPEEAYCNIDETAVFHCAAANGQPVVYEWQYRNFLTNTASSLIINWTKFADSQDASVLTRPGVEYNAYRCKVYRSDSKRKYAIEDKSGNLVDWEYRYHVFYYTEPVHIKVYYPLEIKKQPNDIITIPNEIARFLLEASNDAPDIYPDSMTSYHPDRSGPPITCQWQKYSPNDEDFVDISDETNSSLSMVATSLLDDSKYRCFVTDGRTSLLSNEVTLTVTENITIETQPQSLTVYEIDQAVFSVEATGGSILYQWEKLENNIWVSISGETNSTYSIPEAKLSDNGLTIRCHLSNGAVDVYTNVVTLTVQKRPLSIVIQPQSITIMEGRTGNLSVRAAGDGLTYQWQYLSGATEWTDLRYQVDSIFEFIASMAMNGQQYRCVVTDENQDSVSSNAATITVTADPSLAPPTIVEQPSSQQVSDGDTATFSLVASGEDLMYQWQTLKDGIWYSISGATLASYSVGANRLLNNAQYRCQVSNAVGSINSDIVRLNVTSGSDISTPSIQIQPRSVTVADGAAAMFATSASGGSLYFQWQVKRNGQWYAINGATNSIYTVVARQSMNGEQYRCQITNSAGTVYTNIVQLTVQSSAPLTFYGYHSIIISGKNTYGEWQMYPTSRPHVAPPEVKTSYVDVPGADGGLDYTELLNGKPNYGYRKGSWEFLLIPQEKWPEVYRSLCNFLHGREHTIVLEDDPKWVYRGRLSVNEWRSAAHNSLITIDYILEPIATSTDDEGYDPDADDLDAAGRILRKPGNEDSAIILWNGTETVVPIDSLFEDGDNILY